jgi:hypothetical protein
VENEINTEKCASPKWLWSTAIFRDVTVVCMFSSPFHAHGACKSKAQVIGGRNKREDLPIEKGLYDAQPAVLQCVGSAG